MTTQTLADISRSMTMRQLAGIVRAKGRSAWDNGADDIALRCDASARELEAAADLYDLL